MKAWQLDRLGGTLKLDNAPIPEPRPGSVIVKIEASALMSYLKAYVEGRLPIYSPPEGRFTPGGNAIGIVHEVGPEVYHLKPGQRVVVSSHVVADETVPEPAQFLLGITAGGPDGKALQADWRDGTLAEYVRAPKGSVTAIDGLDAINPAELAVLPRFAIPYGGLIRARLTAGETIIVTGATGSYGTAAVLLAVALGAARVVAAGRNVTKLDALARLGGPRVATVALSGDIKADAESLRAAAAGGAQAALDIVGNAQDPNATLAALRALPRGGRLVLMGSMGVPLPIPYLDVMLNNLEIIGQFMYPRDVFRRLGELARSGLLNINAIRTRSFPLDALASAMEAAAQADGLECVVVKPSWKRLPNRQTRFDPMQVLQHAFRLTVASDKFEQAIAFYERIQGIRCERRMNIPETGINAAKVGGFLIFTGAPESLARVRDVNAIFYVDSIDAFVPWLNENGAEILARPRMVTGGKNATVRNPDGLVVEYFEAAR